MKKTCKEYGDVRVIAQKSNVWGNEGAIMLVLQEKHKHWLWSTDWKTVKMTRRIHISVEKYWCLREPRGPMVLTNNYGDAHELWFPHLFNLEQRMDELVKEYRADKASKLQAKEVLNAQMDNL